MYEFKMKNGRRFDTKESPLQTNDIDDILYAMMRGLSTVQMPEIKEYLSETNFRRNRSIILGLKEYAAAGNPTKKLRRNLNKLIEVGLIEEGKIKSHGKMQKCFFFPFNSEQKQFIKIDQRLLKYLAHTKSRCSIQIFIYLNFKYQINKYLRKIGNTDNYYSFTLKELSLYALGFSKSSRHQYEMIKDILTDLSNSGCIELTFYRETAIVNGKEVPTPKMRLINLVEDPNLIKDPKIENFLKEEIKADQQQETRLEDNEDIIKAFMESLNESEKEKELDVSEIEE